MNILTQKRNWGKLALNTKLASLATLKSEARARLTEPLYRNSLVLLVTSAARACLGFVFWVIVGRLYPTAEVGFGAALLSALGLLAVFSTLGLHIGLIRFLPTEEKKGAMINSSVTIVGFLAVAVALIFIFGLPLWSPRLLILQKNPAYFASFLLFAIAMVLLLMQQYSFIALRSPQFYFGMAMVWDILRIGLAIVLVSWGARGILSAWGIGLCSATIVGSLFLARVVPGYRPWPTIQRRVINNLIPFASANYLAEMLMAASPYLLPLVVLSVLGSEATAYFYIAFRIASLLFLIPINIGTTLFAEGSYQPAKLRPKVLQAIKFIFLLLLPAIAVVSLLGSQILALFGQVYSQKAYLSLVLLSLSSIPIALISLYIVVKRVQRQLSPPIYVGLAASALTLTISYAVMAKVGLLGASVGWALGQGVVAVVLLGVVLRQELRGRRRR